MGERSRASSPDLEGLDDRLLAARIQALVDRGLERYGKGDLIGALSEWEHAVALHPGARRAQEYIDYVRQNFDMLDQRFRQAESLRDFGVPLGEAAPPEDDDDDAYDLVELELGPRTESGPPPAPPGLDDAIDGGWVLDELSRGGAPADD